jgi:hypothetical protein
MLIGKELQVNTMPSAALIVLLYHSQRRQDSALHILNAQTSIGYGAADLVPIDVAAATICFGVPRPEEHSLLASQQLTLNYFSSALEITICDTLFFRHLYRRGIP